MNKRVLLHHPVDDGPLSLDAFDIVEHPIPTIADLKEGQICVKNIYLAIEPYIRGLLKSKDSYMRKVSPGSVLPAIAVGKVFMSKSNKFKTGEPVYGMFGWQDFAVVQESEVWGTVSNDIPIEQWTYYLHCLGMPGLTSYFGIYEVAALKEGETVLISSASSTVGTLVAQLAKMKRCTVIGLTSSDAKIAKLKERGFDILINYNQYPVSELTAKIIDSSPKGPPNVYFDNVGGDISDAAIASLSVGGRVAICGLISQYNATEKNKLGARLYNDILGKSLRVQGFLVFSFHDRFPEANTFLLKALKEKKIFPSLESIEKGGLPKAPQVLIDLLENKITGKPIIQLAPLQ